MSMGRPRQHKSGATALASRRYWMSDLPRGPAFPYASQTRECRKNRPCRKTPLNEHTPRLKLAERYPVPIQPDRGGTMSRRIRYALSLLLVSFALTAAACADASGPSSETTCDHNNPIGCH
jgi:hypothetical protein